MDRFPKQFWRYGNLCKNNLYFPFCNLQLQLIRWILLRLMMQATNICCTNTLVQTELTYMAGRDVINVKLYWIIFIQWHTLTNGSNDMIPNSFGWRTPYIRVDGLLIFIIFLILFHLFHFLFLFSSSLALHCRSLFHFNFINQWRIDKTPKQINTDPAVPLQMDTAA